jgi:uracil-DNA glycosylase
MENTCSQNRPLLVGLCPPPDAGVDDRPLDGLAGARLLAFAGLSIPSWLRPTRVSPGDVLEAYADAVNLWPDYVARRPAMVSEARAVQMDCRGRVVVLLGREVQRAFRSRVANYPADFYCWTCPAKGDDALLYVTIPHPSGLNRMFNRKEHRQWTGRVLRRAMEVVV